MKARKRPRGPSLPLNEKAALTYREVQELGLCSERKLHELVAAGRVTKSILRVDHTVRFLREQLVAELRSLAS